jgi:nucleotide-binding universal stress UspA family protein
MTKDEALKLALVAFGEIDWSNNSQWQSDRAKVAITAIKEAVANEALEKMAENARELGLDYEPPQRTWVGLTDKEIDELWMSHHDDFGNALSATDYERAIEAKLKEKNS